MEAKQKFDVLAVPCARSFVVTSQKTEEFKNLKPDPEIRQQMKEMTEKIKINISVEEGPVLKKTRKFNKK